MTVIPAIDLLGGRCVRLREGRYEEATVYAGDPAEVAQRMVAAGATRIHVVDLDAARGTGDNMAAIAAIRAAVACVVEVGGGVRSVERVARLLDSGINYAIVGTLLAREPDTIAGWAARYGEALVASIDARDGLVRVAGWREETGIAAIDLARYAGEIGLAAIEYTNISRDGTMMGPDVDGTCAVARATTIPVILSGGVARTEDVRAVLRRSRGAIAGMIVGRALYEGYFDLARAIGDAMVADDE